MFADLFGDVLLTKEGQKETDDVLKGKLVAVYFSAHWCGPCRGFTPMLAAAYAGHLKAKGLEIVFVSSDRTEEEFREYFGEMPWSAVPFAGNLKQKLSKKFEVSGIPTLVLLDKDGSLVTKDAVSQVAEDPQGKNFPWTPPSLMDILSRAAIQNINGETFSMARLEGKVIGLYFSAHWCPPCRYFTPELVKQYEKIQKAGHPFEIIFVSSDRTHNDFTEYFAEMPWLAIHFDDRATKGALARHFEVSGIPFLVLLDKDLSLITSDGRTAVMQAEFPFDQKKLPANRCCSIM